MGSVGLCWGLTDVALEALRGHMTFLGLYRYLWSEPSGKLSVPEVSEACCAGRRPTSLLAPFRMRLFWSLKVVCWGHFLCWYHLLRMNLGSGRWVRWDPGERVMSL